MCMCVYTEHTTHVLQLKNQSNPNSCIRVDDFDDNNDDDDDDAIKPQKAQNQS